MISACVTRWSDSGGYKYRLCPKTERLTEECFQRPEHQLEFATDFHLIKFSAGERRIRNTIVREGGGVGWALNPIPNNGHAGSTCDDWTGHACTIGCPTEPTLEAAAAAGKTAPGCPGATYDASATAALFPNQLSTDGSGELGKNVAIQDVLRVPRVPAGEYVVGFRW